MDISKIIPLMTAGGVGYSESESVQDMVDVPINVAKSAATQHELSNIYKMALLQAMSDDLPANFTSDFSNWLKKNFRSPTKRDTSLDFWSNAYRVKEYSTEYEFWSYGPDEQDDTEDDIWVVLEKDMF